MDHYSPRTSSLHLRHPCVCVCVCMCVRVYVCVCVCGTRLTSNQPHPACDHVFVREWVQVKTPNLYDGETRNNVRVCVCARSRVYYCVGVGACICMCARTIILILHI